MAKLSWNDFGERFFELGVDRGVLYPSNGDGVPWNGLIGVSESPSGGTAEPYYIDGVKYSNEASPEEFGGSIEAYTYPDEFAECDGTAVVGSGMSLNQQRRKTFGLSYRTRVGNDISGDDLGYKIHLIYNALAEPTQKEYSTVGDNIDPLEFSWDFTTMPIRTRSGLAPASHITIDSTKSTPTQMRLIEEHLYGSWRRPARLLTLEQLFEWFDNPPVTLYILPARFSGMSPLQERLDGDLVGRTDLGLYRTTLETRLQETSVPGFFTLGAALEPYPAYEIFPDYLTGLSLVRESMDADLIGATYEGLFTAASESNLIETAEPGLNILE